MVLDPIQFTRNAGRLLHEKPLVNGSVTPLSLMTHHGYVCEPEHVCAPVCIFSRVHL